MVRSRKKSKGRERKAKKEEAVRTAVYNEWRALARGEVIDGNGRIVADVKCNHGFETVIPEDLNHPVCGFLSSYYNKMGWFEALFKHETTICTDSNREMTIDIMISIGTNLIMYKKLRTNEDIKHVCDIAMIITVLDHFNGVSIGSTICSREVTPKLRNLSYEGIERKRDVLKVFYKRNTCSCLGNMYSESRRTFRKLGHCNHCQKVSERALLDVCSQCMVTQYCSRECQVAAWHRHKNKCVDDCKDK